MHSRNWTFIFQLTPSRRATYHFHDGGYFRDISTHALTEGDKYPLTPSSMLSLFQLTPSRRATLQKMPKFYKLAISTHALTEGDKIISDAATENNISTHALTEGDIRRSQNDFRNYGFQLTPSRRATPTHVTIRSTGRFQLTPSRRATPSG